MRQLKRLRYLLVASRLLTACLCVLLIINSVNRIGLRDVNILLYLFIALAPNLMHVFVSYSLVKKYYPDREVPRSFIVTFNIVSVFAWLIWAGLVTLLLSILLRFIGNPEILADLNSPGFFILGIFVLLTSIMPFQFIAGYRLLAVIKENHRKNLIDSFN